jgi:hypothetical protein
MYRIGNTGHVLHSLAYRKMTNSYTSYLFCMRALRSSHHSATCLRSTESMLSSTCMRNKIKRIAPAHEVQSSLVRVSREHNAGAVPRRLKWNIDLRSLFLPFGDSQLSYPIYSLDIPSAAIGDSTFTSRSRIVGGGFEVAASTQPRSNAFDHRHHGDLWRPLK